MLNMGMRKLHCEGVELGGKVATISTWGQFAKNPQVQSKSY